MILIFSFLMTDYNRNEIQVCRENLKFMLNNIGSSTIEDFQEK